MPGALAGNMFVGMGGVGSSSAWHKYNKLYFGIPSPQNEFSRKVCNGSEKVCRGQGSGGSAFEAGKKTGRVNG